MVVHIQSTLTKRDDLTKEQFDNYWSTHHGDLFMKNPVAQKYVLRYTQSHFDSGSNERFAAVGAKIPSGFDGIANFWFNSLDDADKVFNSDYYKDVVVPDEARMMKRDQTTIFVTNDEEHWADGKPGTKTST